MTKHVRISLSRQTCFCCDKHTFIATKDVFCHDKHVCWRLLWQKSYLWQLLPMIHSNFFYKEYGFKVSLKFFTSHLLSAWKKSSQWYIPTFFYKEYGFKVSLKFFTSHLLSAWKKSSQWYIPTFFYKRVWFQGFTEIFYLTSSLSMKKVQPMIHSNFFYKKYGFKVSLKFFTSHLLSAWKKSSQWYISTFFYKEYGFKVSLKFFTSHLLSAWKKSSQWYIPTFFTRSMVSRFHWNFLPHIFSQHEKSPANDTFQLFFYKEYGFKVSLKFFTSHLLSAWQKSSQWYIPTFFTRSMVSRFHWNFLPHIFSQHEKSPANDTFQLFLQEVWFQGFTEIFYLTSSLSMKKVQQALGVPTMRMFSAVLTVLNMKANPTENLVPPATLSSTKMMEMLIREWATSSPGHSRRTNSKENQTLIIHSRFHI